MRKQIVMLSREILHDRGMRRRWMGRFCFFQIGYFALGLWVINGWLEQSLLRLAVYWCFCAGMAILLLLFALYDALRVMREERDAE